MKHPLKFFAAVLAAVVLSVIVSTAVTAVLGPGYVLAHFLIGWALGMTAVAISIERDWLF